MIAGEAQAMAERLMAEYGLEAPQWSFRFDNGRRRFGSCQRETIAGEFLAGAITLSRALTRANDAAAVEATLRHEIAHALAPIGAGHGPAWRKACAITGAIPRACYGDEVAPAPGTYAFTCERCGASGRRVRLPRNVEALSHCRGAALRWRKIA